MEMSGGRKRVLEAEAQIVKELAYCIPRIKMMSHSKVL
jgi:hypothetical protein